MSSSNILSCTPKALQYLQKKLSVHPDRNGLRLGIKKSGCSGWLYTFEYGAQVQATEVACVLKHDIAVFINKKFLSVFQGACLDYVKSGLHGYLTCLNPNITAQCGCGESFSLNAQENI